MKLASSILIIVTIMCVMESAHPVDWTHYYLKAACKLMESRNVKDARSDGMLFMYLFKNIANVYQN